jgi:hypothetical protein
MRVKKTVNFNVNRAKFECRRLVFKKRPLILFLIHLHKSINTIEMNAFKKIAIIAGVGTVIGVAYYFFKKRNVTVTEDTSTKGRELTPISEIYGTNKSVEEQLQIDKCAGLSRVSCEKLIAKLDKETAEANGTPFVSTYISNNSAGTGTSDTSTTSTGSSNPRVRSAGSSTPRTVTISDGGRR